MDRSHWSCEHNDHRESDRYLEIESELRSMRVLVCDLLKKNEDLRQALSEAGLPHGERLADDLDALPASSQHRK